MPTDLSTFNNNWYNPGKNAFFRLTWYLVNIMFIKSSFPFNSIKISLLRLFGATIGNNVVIKPHVNIKYPWNLVIGNNVWIGELVWIDNLAKVQINDQVCISQGAMLLTGNHNYKKASFDLIVKEITLEEGVWIGAKSVVCPGIICHSHSILSVGSVANQNLLSFSIYQGNPATKIRDRKIEN